MALAGREERSIRFSKGGNSQHVQEETLEAFPILETAGGYKILKTGDRGNRQLRVLSIPPGGYTVPYLKATIASAKAPSEGSCACAFIRAGPNAGECFYFFCQILQ